MTFDLGDGVGYVSDAVAQNLPAVWVISVEANQIFALDAPGSAIWVEALGAGTPDDVVDRLCKQYGWDADVIGMDVTDFLSDLVARGWLKEMVSP